MRPPSDRKLFDADDRLDEVARLLAVAILRAKLRRNLKRNLPGGTRDFGLELRPPTSPPVREQSRKGEP